MHECRDQGATRILSFFYLAMKSFADLQWPAGGEIASTFDSPDNTKLGSCKLIEEIMIGEDKLIHFSGVEMGAACTIVLRGASELPCCPAIFSPRVGCRD